MSWRLPLRLCRADAAHQSHNSYEAGAIELASGLTALLSVCAANAVQATSFSGGLTADNLFSAYISTDDSQLGLLIGSGSDWQLTTTFTYTGILTPGVTNYLHIVATDQGPPQMFVGSFALGDTDFQFANGTQSLVTNTVDWRADPGAGTWFAPSGTPTTFGTNGCCVWGLRPNIDASAQFIWADGIPLPGVAFLSTTISPTTAAVPLPATLPLFASGLAGLGWLSRRRRSSDARVPHNQELGGANA